MEELDYIEEPDMFHDVFGHIPLLTHPDYADFAASW
jgi:phenylalanine-4-hydroxylase